MSNPTSWAVKAPTTEAPLHPPALHGNHVEHAFDGNIQAKGNVLPGDYLTFHEFPPGKKSPTDATCRALVGVFLDFDMVDWLAHTQVVANGVAPHTRDEVLKAMHEMSAEELASKLAEYLVFTCSVLTFALPNAEPNLIVCTGYGYHVHYWYKRTVPVAKSDVLAQQRAYVKQIIADVTAKFGFAAIDAHSATINKFVRVPGTTNKKNKDIPREVRVIHYNEIHHLNGIDSDRVRLAKATDRRQERQATKDARREVVVVVNRERAEAVQCEQGAPQGSTNEFRGDLATLDIKTMFNRYGTYLGPKAPTTAAELEAAQKMPKHRVKHFVVCPFRDSYPGHDKTETHGNPYIFEADQYATPTPSVASFYCHWCAQRPDITNATKHDGTQMSPATALTYAVINQFFTPAIAYKFCKPRSSNRRTPKRGDPLPLKSISQLRQVFTRDMPYAMDNGLAYAQNSFYFFNTADNYWEKMTQESLLVDLEIFDGIRYVSKDGEELPWAIAPSEYIGTLGLIKNHAQNNPASLWLAKNAEGLLFNNGYLRADGEFITDAEEIKALGVIKAQLADCDWVPEERAPSFRKECPKFNQYLDEALYDESLAQVEGYNPDEDPRRAVLMEFPGGALLGCGVKLGKALVVRGLSNTGKSTYCNVMQALFQTEAFCSVHPQEFNTSFGLAPLAGARMNFVDDMKHTEMTDPGKWKSVIRGEIVKINEKFEKAYNYYPIAGHLYGTNHPLRSKIADSGVISRITEIEFKNVRSTEKQNRGLVRDIITEERGAILRHCVYAALKVLAKKNCALTALPGEQAKVLEMEEESDMVLSFIKNECVRIEPVKGQVCGYTGVDLFQRFMRYCAMSNRPTKTDAGEFGKRAKQLLGDEGWKRTEHGIRYFVHTTYEPLIGNNR